MKIKKIAVPLGFLAVGAMLVTVLFVFSSRPRVRETEEATKIVEGIEVRTMTVVPWVTTYGEVHPDSVWSAVAQVGGKVVWKAPTLQNGQFFEAREELLRIDDREYLIAVARAGADVAKGQARLEELITNQKNVEAQIGLLAQAVEFNERELARQRSLFESRAAPAATVDRQTIAVLDQRRALAALEASHAQFPSQIAYQEAELGSLRAALEQAEINLARTVIRAPFRGRIDRVGIADNQFVPVGQTMFILDSTAAAEIPIALNLNRLAMLAGQAPEEAVEELKKGKNPAQAESPGSVTVKLSGADSDFAWEGKFARMAPSVDPATRMLGFVVVVDDPFGRLEDRRAAAKPPLAKGAFCAVILRGRPQPDRIVVPRRALHGGDIYVVDGDSRLEIRPATIRYHLGQYTVLESGVAAGETIVASDVLPAVEGMRLDVRPNTGFYEQAERAIGEGRHD